MLGFPDDGLRGTYCVTNHEIRKVGLVHGHSPQEQRFLFRPNPQGHPAIISDGYSRHVYPMYIFKWYKQKPECASPAVIPPTDCAIVVTSPVNYNVDVAITGKQKAARTLGRPGNLKGGNARAQALSPERRKEIARNAVSARWAKVGTPSANGVSETAAPAAPDGQTLPFDRSFFEAKTIDQLIAKQGVHPITDFSVLAGSIPDEDIDEFVAEIYRNR